MFIDFNKHSYIITDISYNDDNDNGTSINHIIIKTNGSKNFSLIAEGDCCSMSFFHKWDNCPFENLIGKVITKCEGVELPEDFKFEEDDYYGCNDCISPHLYEFSFKDSEETFKFMLVNYSNGYYDGWITFDLIDS